MTTLSLSDLSQSLLLRRDNAALKRELSSASRELTTGKREDVIGYLNGKLEALSQVETSLRRSESYLNNIAEQRYRYAAAQSALETVRSLAGDLVASLAVVGDTADANVIASAGKDALARFNSVVSVLNTSSGGSSLFSGVATDTPPLAEAETILVALETEIALSGAASAQSVSAVIDAWFSSGGGFDTLGYLGGPPSSNGVPISDSAVSAPLATAQDTRVRRFLAAAAMSALVGRGILSGNISERADLARDSGLRLVAAQEGIVQMQAEFGSEENRIERTSTEILAAQSVWRQARSDMIGVDPFDAATRLRETQGRLESLYTMTARLSRLTLTEFLR